MTAGRSGRKTREERLVFLKEKRQQLQEQKDKLNEEIRSIDEQIKEIEQYYLLQNAAKIKEAASKSGVSVDDLIKALETGTIVIPPKE